MVDKKWYGQGRTVADASDIEVKFWCFIIDWLENINCVTIDPCYNCPRSAVLTKWRWNNLVIFRSFGLVLRFKYVIHRILIDFPVWSSDLSNSRNSHFGRKLWCRPTLTIPRFIDNPNCILYTKTQLPACFSYFCVRLVQIWSWIWLVGWLVVFNVPSTARSFRDGTPIYCPLRMTWSSINSLHRSDRESNRRPSHGSPLRYRWATRSIWTLILESITKTSRSYKMKGIKSQTITLAAL